MFARTHLKITNATTPAMIMRSKMTTTTTTTWRDMIRQWMRRHSLANMLPEQAVNWKAQSYTSPALRPSLPAIFRSNLRLYLRYERRSRQGVRSYPAIDDVKNKQQIRIATIREKCTLQLGAWCWKTQNFLGKRVSTHPWRQRLRDLCARRFVRLHVR